MYNVNSTLNPYQILIKFLLYWQSLYIILFFIYSSYIEQVSILNPHYILVMLARSLYYTLLVF